MANKQITITNGTGTQLLLAQDNGDTTASFYHVEDAAQRALLIAALQQIGTATNQTAGNASLATIATKIGGTLTQKSVDAGGNAIHPAANALTGTLTATGQSAGVIVRGDFNVTFTGTFSATIQVERSFDSGSSWSPLTALGTGFTFSGPATEIFSEPEFGVKYRVNCTAYTSGTISYRISQ